MNDLIYTISWTIVIVWIIKWLRGEPWELTGRRGLGKLKK